MRPIKCMNCEKFYDGDKYEICPHCKGEPIVKGKTGLTVKKPPITQSGEAQRQTSVTPTAKEEKKAGKGLFGILRKEKLQNEQVIISDDESLSDVPGNAAAVRPEGQIPETEVISEQKQTPWTGKPDDWADGVATEQGKVPEIHNSVVRSVQPVQPVRSVQPESVRPEPAPEPDPEPVREERAGNVSLADAIKQADSTMTSNDKTVAFYNFSNDIEPVVGWIICVAGEYMGESFELHSGRNNIGRSLSMDIALAKEKSVSRERHASITFEPHQKKFFIQAGESSGLTYVNDELLMMFRELEDYDVLTLGDSKFIFLRFVSDRFSWEDYT